MSSVLEKPYDYSVALSPDDFGYYHTRPSGVPSLAEYIGNRILEPAFEEVKERYGIQVQHLTWGELPEAGSRAPYVLAGPVNPLDMAKGVTNHLARLAGQRNARINLVAAMSYGLGEDTSSYHKQAGIVIPALDAELGVNTIFPDDTDGLYYGLRTVTARDVADNIVCETIRLKYQANRIENSSATNALVEAQTEAADDTGELSRIYREYGLWHRGETDGAFMVHADAGWLTTQTKTDKTDVLPDNMSLVLDWSAEDSAVDFVGPKLPSSDVPEFLILGDYARKRLAGHQDIRLVVHFHHNPTTRGTGFDNLRTPNLIEYGRFESGQEIIENMKHRGTNGLILTEHGLVWIGESTEQFEDFVSSELGIPKIQ
jgi:hypothetical protein